MWGAETQVHETITEPVSAAPELGKITNQLSGRQSNLSTIMINQNGEPVWARHLNSSRACWRTFCFGSVQDVGRLHERRNNDRYATRWALLILVTRGS